MSQFSVDVKGKGRADPIDLTTITTTDDEGTQSESILESLEILEAEKRGNDAPVAGSSQSSRVTASQTTAASATPTTNPRKKTFGRKSINSQSTPSSVKRLKQPSQVHSTPGSGRATSPIDIASSDEDHKAVKAQAIQDRRKSMSRHRTRSPVKRTSIPSFHKEYDLTAYSDGDAAGPSSRTPRLRPSIKSSRSPGKREDPDDPMPFASQSGSRGGGFQPGSWNNPTPMVIAKPKPPKPMFAEGSWENPVPMMIGGVHSNSVKRPSSPDPFEKLEMQRAKRRKVNKPVKAKNEANAVEELDQSESEDEEELEVMPTTSERDKGKGGGISDSQSAEIDIVTAQIVMQVKGGPTWATDASSPMILRPVQRTSSEGEPNIAISPGNIATAVEDIHPFKPLQEQLNDVKATIRHSDAEQAVALPETLNLLNNPPEMTGEPIPDTTDIKPVVDPPVANAASDSIDNATIPDDNNIPPIPNTIASSSLILDSVFEADLDGDDLGELEDLELPDIIAASRPHNDMAIVQSLPSNGGLELQTQTEVITAKSEPDEFPMVDASVSSLRQAYSDPATQDPPLDDSLERKESFVRAVSDDSIEEIEPDVARLKPAFNGSTRTSKVLTQTSQNDNVDRKLSKELKALQNAEAGPSSPRNPLKRSQSSQKVLTRSDGSSSSGGAEDSPSKRQSARLAVRGLAPVYSFTQTGDPVQWRQVVHDDGLSDGLRPKTSPSSNSIINGPTFIDGHKFTIHRVIPIPIPVDDPPPVERQSTAVRAFDTRLIDDWNGISHTLTRNPPLHRTIFQSYVAECVAQDEPESSEIQVINEVDLEAIPPNFEFQYSNKMLYHQEVPDPELGKGCDCDGPCRENAKGCSCLKRQQLYNYGMIKGFAYNKDGTLKNHSVSIWECGDSCGCPPECMNRVIQGGRGKKTDIDLFKTRNKGWGVRARSKIPMGTFLGIYSGELITELESERRGQIYANVGRTYLFDLDGWQIAHPPAGLERLDPRLAEIAAAAEQRAKITLQNAGDDADAAYNAYSVDAFHYGFTRFFNHSCDPNMAITQAYVRDFHPERPLLVIFACRDIRPGEELCISYKGVPDEEDPLPKVEEVKAVKGKKRKAKTSASAHVLSKKEAKKDRCLWNCDGVMFAVGGDVSD